MGVGLSLILLIPGNMLIHSIADSASVTAALPLQAALVLIALATLLTILGGLIPAKSASSADPLALLQPSDSRQTKPDGRFTIGQPPAFCIAAHLVLK